MEMAKFFEGPNEAAEMHRKTVNLGKNRASKVKMYLENESVRSKVMSRKVGAGLKAIWWPERKTWAEIVPGGCPWKRMTLCMFWG